MNTLVRPFPLATEHPWWQRWVDRSLEEDLTQYGAPLRLHHYVRSWVSLLSILTRRTLWATDARHFTDTTELVHGLPTCFEALDHIREPMVLEHVDILKQGLKDRFQYRTFVACVSSANDIESQWEEYADQGRGFVITFDTRILSALSGVRLMPVEYGQDAQVERARRAVNRALEEIEIASPDKSNYAFVAWTIHSRFSLLATELFYLCTTFKAWNLRQEHEWRVIYTRHDNDEGGPEIQTRDSMGRDAQYVELDLTQRYFQHHLPTFEAVRGGPRINPNSAHLAQGFLKEFMKDTRWEVQPPFR